MKKKRDIGDEELSDDVFDDADGNENLDEIDTGPSRDFTPSGVPLTSDGGPSLIRTNRSIKVWMMVAGVFVIIAIGVLYIYQAGDRRTVLGNQPIPAEQLLPAASPAPLGAPDGARNGVSGAIPLETPSAPPKIARQGASSAKANGLVRCPRCVTDGLPVCSSCGAVMHPMGDGSGLCVCPICGVVGVSICPRCGAHMAASDVLTDQHSALGQRPGATSGQFQCTNCGATGLPNWRAAGIPLCPACGGTMKVR